MEYKKLTITIPKKLFLKYKKTCDENGLKLSGRISVLIEKDLQSISLTKLKKN